MSEIIVFGGGTIYGASYFQQTDVNISLFIEYNSKYLIFVLPLFGLPKDSSNRKYLTCLFFEGTVIFIWIQF